jgi:hypothetical protein
LRYLDFVRPPSMVARKTFGSKLVFGFFAIGVLPIGVEKI